MEKEMRLKRWREKMRAVQIHAPGEFSVDWDPPYRIRGRGEVLVEGESGCELLVGLHL